MQKFEVIVINEVGLHARPAAAFAQKAAKFKSTIKIRNATIGNNFANAKSIIGVLSLGVERNHLVELEIEGEDELQAAEGLKALIESDFRQ